MRDLRVAVIGAGMAGIASVIKLREAGIDDVTVFESNWLGTVRQGQPAVVARHLLELWPETYRVGIDSSAVCSFLASSSERRIDEDLWQLRRRKDADELELMKKAIAKNPKSASLQVNLGMALSGKNDVDGASKAFGDDKAAYATVMRTLEHLKDNKVPLDDTEYMLGPALTFDNKTEKFTGDNAAAANALLTKKYRAPYVLPEV